MLYDSPQNTQNPPKTVFGPDDDPEEEEAEEEQKEEEERRRRREVYECLQS